MNSVSVRKNLLGDFHFESKQESFFSLPLSFSSPRLPHSSPSLFPFPFPSSFVFWNVPDIHLNLAYYLIERIKESLNKHFSAWLVYFHYINLPSSRCPLRPIVCPLRIRLTKEFEYSFCFNFTFPFYFYYIKWPSASSFFFSPPSSIISF